ncbi:hypothetical protein LWI29_025693 [Acer saccharum]|uniref:Uncharacterized protein n=1 Tax=Acer saccharum TaxID=4024 RepID=A0AA39VSJ1_ACESA|nr:hypothetical protein LWI29_025693 [Acer saccharum]
MVAGCFVVVRGGHWGDMAIDWNFRGERGIIQKRGTKYLPWTFFEDKQLGAATFALCNSFQSSNSKCFKKKTQPREGQCCMQFLPLTVALLIQEVPNFLESLFRKGFVGTRHNVGFEMIDHICRAQGVLMNTIQSKALVGIGCIGEVPILLAKPQAYMNFSGESVGPLAAYYQVPLRHILVIHDEMSLMNGVLRLQPKGGHGHHNGVKSVIGHLDGCRDCPRLCIGIGNPPGTMDMKAFLLQKFSSVERKQIDAALEQGVEAVRTLVLNGFSSSITRFNMGQKYKYHKV